MVVNISQSTPMFMDPLTFVLHSTATFGIVCIDESFITFLFVLLSASARSLTPEW